MLRAPTRFRSVRLLVAGLLAASPTADAATTAACVGATSAGVPVQKIGSSAIGTVDVLSPLAQVLTIKRIAGASSATLCSAKNAYASFRLEVSANLGTSIGGLTVIHANLTGPNNALLTGSGSGASADVRFSRED